MRFRALATDFDGTLAHDGVVDDDALEALRRVRDSGRRLLLVTGRELPSLFNTFAHPNSFDLIVAENGAVLYDPATGRIESIAEPAPPTLIEALQHANIPLSVGHSIIATVTPHEQAVLQAIRDQRLEWHVIFNKDAVMALPSGVNKATGLAAALRTLAIAAHEIVGVGDAENDEAFLKECGLSVAVNNALDQVKAQVDFTTTAACGKGVQELIQRLLNGELDSIPLATEHS
jgi:hydroxymethylpyrimidine pyrophosphatase-like HAD family hydrolase